MALSFLKYHFYNLRAEARNCCCFVTPDLSLGLINRHFKWVLTLNPKQLC